MNLKVEDDVDFFAELKSALTPYNEIKTNLTLDTSCCLITHDKLEDNYITLTCGHTFNYLPLYHEVVKQKNGSHLETSYLSLNQIKCPYCREKTNKLLPYIEHPQIILKRGVNFPAKYCMTIHTCSWVFKTGKNKGYVCGKDATVGEFGIYCNKHRLMESRKKKLEIGEWTTKHQELYKKYKIEDLKKILRTMKLNVSGTKKMLINRLVNAPEDLKTDSGVVV